MDRNCGGAACGGELESTCSPWGELGGSPGAGTGWGLLDYKTEKYVMTKNWRVGTLQRLLQLGVLVCVEGSLSV
uniref:Uncharacterized protein n=1 Tax=Equus asinus TaxID=9793 RepID=A0A9L0JWJ9_EQUAS